MDLRHALVALFCIALMGASHARESITSEDYWQAIWPNTPIPSTLKELLKPRAEDAQTDYLPTKRNDMRNPEGIFFDHDLYPGKTMNLQFNNNYSQPIGIRPLWLGRNSSIKEYEQKLKGFNGYEETCIRRQPVQGEHKYCAKSLETTVGFAISKLGKNIQPLSSSYVDKQDQYTIEGVHNLGDKAVMCHRLNFQKVVFYCHQIHETTAYRVPMVAADGTRTKALAVCHHETSALNAEFLYEQLKVNPGDTTVCHFLGNKAIMWVPNLAVDNAYNANMAS